LTTLQFHIRPTSLNIYIYLVIISQVNNNQYDTNDNLNVSPSKSRFLIYGKHAFTHAHTHTHTHTHTQTASRRHIIFLIIRPSSIFLEETYQTLHTWFTVNNGAFVKRYFTMFMFQHSHFCYSLCSDIMSAANLLNWFVTHGSHSSIYNECVSAVSLKLLFTPQACLWIMSREF